MAGGKKSKRDGDKKSRKRARENEASREPSDDDISNDESSNQGPDSMVPAASKINIEAKAEQAAVEDELGAKVLRKIHLTKFSNRKINLCCSFTKIFPIFRIFDLKWN